MPKIIVDKAMESKLKRAGVCQICDESGHTLGVFSPMALPVYEEGEEPGITEQELQELLKEPARPLADILVELERIA